MKAPPGRQRHLRVFLTATTIAVLMLVFVQVRAATTSPVVDLNGDGNGDVFTYNPVTGDWARQVSLDGGGFTTTMGEWSPGWTVIPVSFDGDALTDFFLFNPISGQWFKMLNDGVGFTEQADRKSVV